MLSMYDLENNKYNLKLTMTITIGNEKNGKIYPPFIIAEMSETIITHWSGHWRSLKLQRRKFML